MPVEPLELLPGGAGELTAFRWSNHDVPFWGRANSRDNRWNYAGIGATQYWALTPSAAWAELIRYEDLRTEEDLELVRMPLWVCRLPNAMLADLRRPGDRATHGISEEDLIGDDWRPCQELAVRLRQSYRGVIAPCAALPEHANVTIFGRRRHIDWESQSAMASTLPAARAAIGRPPNGLVDRVRRYAPPPTDDRLF